MRWMARKPPPAEPALPALPALPVEPVQPPAVFPGLETPGWLKGGPAAYVIVRHDDHTFVRFVRDRNEAQALQYELEDSGLDIQGCEAVDVPNSHWELLSALGLKVEDPQHPPAGRIPWSAPLRGRHEGEGRLDVALLQTTFLRAAEVRIGQKNITDFIYQDLFLKRPQLKPMFTNHVMQRHKLGKMLGSIFIHLRDQDWIGEHLRDLGAMHWRAGVTPEMYPWIKDSVLSVLEEGMAPNGWNLRCQREWAAALDVIAGGMLEGYPTAGPPLGVLRSPHQATRQP
jgi:hemoglobin-like flavoprotein